MTTILINGTHRDIDADPQMPLLWAIRDILGLTGTKFGCGIGACGACTVHMDGAAVRSCMVTLSLLRSGHAIVTIEGLSPNGTHPVQRAWDGQQCSTMWLLPARSNHAGRGTPQTNAKAERSADCRSNVGQHLPLWHLSAHPCGHQVSSGVDLMTAILNMTRRDILSGGAATGLVLGFHVGLQICQCRGGDRPDVRAQCLCRH